MNITNAIKYMRFGIGGKYRCIACNKKVRKFFKFSDNLKKQAEENGFPYDFKRMETLNFEQCNCPFCLTNDRERLYLIFIEDYVLKNKHKLPIKMLDFAPNKYFSNYLKRIEGVEYFSADLFMQEVDFQVDICNMTSIADSSFDFIICSHILEHVQNPDKALSELKRILTPNGYALIMVPLFWDVKETLEDNTHKSKQDRCKYYGQDDHVRLFSREDFIGRIKRAGFVLKEFYPKDFDNKLINENAISSNSILYVCYNK
jgi:SAM-dependent methyltransferase